MRGDEVSWFALFLNLFALGLVGSIAAVPFRQIGSYYFRFHATLALVLVVIAVLVGRPWEAFAGGSALTQAAAGAALLFALVVLVENFVVRAAKSDLRTDALLFPVSTGVLFAAVDAFARSGFGVGGSILLTLHLLTAAAVLGTSFVAMTTGHWYLSNARLPFTILVRLSWMFVIAVAAKAAVVAVYAILHGGEYMRLEGFYRLVMGVRVGAGIVLAMVLALMTLACARRRANQSATGILYVGVVFVLIGETISLYLTLPKEWPI